MQAKGQPLGKICTGETSWCRSASFARNRQLFVCLPFVIGYLFVSDLSQGRFSWKYVLLLLATYLRASPYQTSVHARASRPVRAAASQPHAITHQLPLTPPIHSLIHSLTHSLILSPPHSPAHALIHSHAKFCARRRRLAWQTFFYVRARVVSSRTQAHHLVHTDLISWGAGITCSSLARY